MDDVQTNTARSGIAKDPRDSLRADRAPGVRAARMCLSERHFARVFKQKTGASPGTYVEAARIEVARRLLETTDRALDQVAAAAGLGSVETLHRAFRRQLATTPAAYRRRFRTQVVRAVPLPSTGRVSRAASVHRPSEPSCLRAQAV